MQMHICGFSSEIRIHSDPFQIFQPISIDSPIHMGSTDPQIHIAPAFHRLAPPNVLPGDPGPTARTPAGQHCLARSRCRDHGTSWSKWESNTCVYVHICTYRFTVYLLLFSVFSYVLMTIWRSYLLSLVYFTLTMLCKPSDDIHMTCQVWDPPSRSFVMLQSPKDSIHGCVCRTT